MALILQGLSGEVRSTWKSPDQGIRIENWAPAECDPLRLWKTQPSLRKVVGFVAEQVSQLPWHAYERISDTDRQRAQGSRAETILRSPSKLVSGAALMESLVIDWMLWDRYLAIVDGSEIIRIPPRRWTVKSDMLGRPVKILLLTGGGAPDLDITDAPLIVDWGWGDVSAGGVSPLITLSEILDEARESVRWRKRQWDTAPRFGGMLRHPSRFKNQEARSTFEVSWQAWRDGRQGTPILEDGMEYVRPPEMNPREARDIEGRQWTDTEVAGAYHIPPELLGIREGNFSNMTAFRSMLFGPTLGPRIARLEQAVGRVAAVLDPGRPSLYLELSREAAINGSLVEQAQVLQTMTGAAFMTRAESRARLNLPHLEGTDELITPLNVLVGGQASPTDSGSQNREGATGALQAFGTVEGEDVSTQDTAPATPAIAASDVKLRLDALGVAVRSGVVPESAASIVGLNGLQFLAGARPVTIRLPEDDATTTTAGTDEEVES